MEADAALLARYRAGEEEAANLLFERYYDRLLALVRRERGPKLARFEATSDVAQSVLRNLFERGRAGDIQLEEDLNLWPYLVTLTLNKLRNRVRFWSRLRRAAGRNVPLGAGPDPLEVGPGPEEVLLLNELTSETLNQFSDRRRRILEMLLDGHEVKDIVADLGTTQRTIYSTRQAACKLLEERLGEE